MSELDHLDREAEGYRDAAYLQRELDAMERRCEEAEREAFDEHAVIERLNAITFEACRRTFEAPAYTEREQGAIGAYRTVAADHGWILSEDTESYLWLAKRAVQ